MKKTWIYSKNLALHAEVTICKEKSDLQLFEIYDKLYCFSLSSKFMHFLYVLQIDLEPEGKVFVIIDLTGSSSEGKVIPLFIMLAC